MQHHRLKIDKTAHVYTHGIPSVTSRYFWFVTHGYGQLASNIIRKFTHLSDAHFVVAPEALNRFYWNPRTNDVGANWMTKLDRLDDIADYSHYLTIVFNQFRAQVPADAKVILLGFSQGCATQIRWIIKTQPDFDALILWAGILPEDIDYQPFKNYFSNKQLHFVCGDNDEFVTPERIVWQEGFAQAQGLSLINTFFEGKHEILTPQLDRLFQRYL